MKRLLVTGCLLFVFLLTIPAQLSTPKGDPDQLFYIATEQFQRGEFAGSYRAIDTWLKESPCGDHLEEAQFIKAASSWELNRRETSLLLIEFLKNWPASPYAEKAYYLLGCSAMEAGQYQDAMAYFKRCPESALSPAERIHYRYRLAIKKQPESYLPNWHQEKAAMLLRPVSSWPTWIMNREKHEKRLMVLLLMPTTNN